MEYHIWNIWTPELYIQHYPVFVSVIILTYIVKVDINVPEVSYKWICEKLLEVQILNRGKERIMTSGDREFRVKETKYSCYDVTELSMWSRP